MERVKSLLLFDENVNVNKYYGQNMDAPLHLAGSKENFDISRMLLQNGAKLDAINENNLTPLHIVLKQDNTKIFSLLMMYGADVHRKSKGNKSYLHIAASYGHMNLCKILLESYILDVTSIDNSGWSVIHGAAESGNTELFQYFIENGSDVYSITNFGKSCLHIATSKGHLNTCKELVENYNFSIYITDDNQYTALHSACESGNLNLCRYLIQEGSDVYSKTKDNKNCLHISVSKGYLHLFRTLFESYKFDINTTNIKGWNVLHYAAKSGSLEVLKYFIQNACDVTSKTKRNKNSLYTAGKRGYLNLCKTLLEIFNFDIHTTDDDGYNVLHYATESGNLKLFYYIKEYWSNAYRNAKDNPSSLHNIVQKRNVKLNYKFDTYPQNNFEKNLLHHVLINNCSDVFQNETENNSHFYKKTKNGRNYLHIAASKGYCLVSKALLETFNFEIHLRDSHGHNFLHCTAESGNLELFKYFIKRGCNVFSKTKDSKNYKAYNRNFKMCRAQNYSFDIRRMDDEGWTVLHCAAKSGNLELFQYLLANGSDTYSKTKNIMNVLHIAAKYGHLKVCALLARNFNFDIHTTDDHCCTVLYWAAISGDLELLEYFIKNGIHIFSVIKDNKNSLHLAVASGHLKICVTLFQNYNFDIHATDDDGWTALHCAANSGDLMLFQYFIEKGSDSRGSLHVAAENKHFVICRDLLENHTFDIQARDNHGMNVLHCAAKGGDLELLNFLIENGRDIFSKTKDSKSSLHLAAENSNSGLCEKLLQNYNFDINTRDHHGLPFLQSAANNADFKIFKYFIENRRDILSKTKNGQSCLHLAAKNGYLKISKALLKNYNFDICATDDSSRTVLQGAALSGDIELLQYLIENGRDTFSKTKDGRSCLHLAAEKGHLKICRTLLQNYNFDIHARDDDIFTVLLRATCSDDLELLEYLIENGRDIFSKTKYGGSCFHLAAQNGHIKICKALLQNYNFDIHARDDDIFTVLLRATCSDDLELLEYLFENGSDIFSKIKDGRSCLHIAARQGHLKICRTLLHNYNFDVYARDDSGRSVLRHAAWSFHLELFQYMIEKGSDIFVKKKNNRSHLYLAAQLGDIKISRAVSQNYNFDINERDDDGFIVLHSAAWSGDSELLQYLIENGSDILSKTKNGRSCFHIAVEQGDLKICRVLLQNYNFVVDERDNDGLAMLHKAALGGDLELLQYLTEYGSDIFSKTKDGRSCLHLPAEEEHLKICKVPLKNHNFDFNASDDDMFSAMLRAACSDDLELLEYLIQNGSDIFSKTKHDGSCWHLAAENGHLKICKALLEKYNFDIHATDDSSWTALHGAAWSGDLELLQYLIENGRDIFSETNDGRSCLHLAAKRGNLKICRALLQNYNLDVYARDDSGLYVLHHAAWSGYLELFQYLIEKGSDIFIKTKNNSSCLHFAAKVGSLKICRVALQNYNFAINARDDDGLTILHSAAWSGDSKLLQYLIEKGSDVYSKTKNGRSSLHIAAEQEHLKICRKLLTNYNFPIHEGDDDGLAVLQNAALGGDLELFQYLIENGSDVFSKTKDGRSCFHLAAEEGHLKICKVLLKNYNFDIHARDDDMFTVMLRPACSDDLELLEYLIKNGSDIFSKAKHGASCLHLAAENGHIKICKALLQKYNFDIHATDDSSWTALHGAAWSGDLELLQYLIENGSDIFSETNDGRSCLHLAAKRGHLKICRALLQNYNLDMYAIDDSGLYVLHHAAWRGYLELFQYLIEKGSDIFIKTKNNSSCLHFAAKVGSLKICRVVLQNYNFDINARDDDGLTILHSAAWSGDSELLQYLIEKGSDVFSKTKNGRSCLHIAAEQGHLKICRILLRNHNFAIHERDDDGLAVLHNAALAGDLELFQYLIENESDVFSKTKNGRSCFHIAAEEGYLKICRVLLENYNFDVHERDDDGLAVLHNAALAGDLELFLYLMENGSDVFSKTKDGRSCFHLAAEKGHLKICKLLLKNYNFDIHARDDDMFTVMLRASCSDDLELLEYLIQNGSDILSKTKHGGSCLHLAAKNGHLKICKALLEKYNFDIHATDDSSWTALHGAAWSGDLELLQYLIENGSDIFSETNDGRSCLHLAAKRGHLKICRALLQNYNLDMYARDDSGLYVLHHAAWSGYLELFQYLIEKGSDIFIKTKNNSSCLHFAAKVGSLKICRVVLQNYNFDINARDDDGLTILHSAAWSGDSELLQYLIEKGSDVYSKTKNGRSCLHIAAEQGHLKICRMLLTHYNFAIHERDDDGLAVLHNAALGGDLELFQYLIENGSDVFSKTKNGRSCFHIAAEEGYLKICRVLLENYNFDVHEIDDDGLAVLHNAALAGDLELFQYLIESGSDVFSKTTDGRSCLHIASRQGHLKVCRALLQNYNFDISVRDDSGWSVLHHAACSFDLEIFQYLIEKGSDIFAKAKSNSSCLHIAAQVGDLKICKAVLQNYDFDINARDDDGFTFLHSAAWSGYSELLKYLIETGSDIFSKTKNGRSCLHIAAEQGHLNICRMLLQRYNFLNHERDDDGLNVLHSAVLSGELELLQYLIENGSDVFSKTKDGRSCLHLAAEQGDLNICRMLLQSYNFVIHETDDDGLTVLHSAVLSGELELLQYLIENGSDVFSKTKDGRNCLHIAAEKGHLNICRALLQNYNFDIDARDDDMFTVLLRATCNDDLELLEYLIENGSDIFSKTTDGRNCLHLAAENGHLEICKALLQKYNFDIDATDDSSWTVLHGAAWSGDLELLQYLIENGSDGFSKTKDGRSCLHLAAEQGDLNICRMLLQSYNFVIHERDDDGLTVLHSAVLSGELELLQYLIENGSDVFSKTKDGRNCLHIAAEKGHLNICRALLQSYNFDIDARDDDMFTVLLRATCNDDLGLLEYLIENGSDIFSKTTDGRSCLHLAAENGHLEICKALLQKYNFDIHATDDSSWTVLHGAAWSGDLELLQYLIENGSDGFSKTKDGRSCLHIAAEQGDLNICRMLLKNYNFVIHETDDAGLTVLHSAALGGDLALLQYLIENGSDVFSKTKNGRSCLHLAAEKGHLDLCRALLQNYNFDIHARDDDMFTVLLHAACSDDLKLLEYLIENGSDLFSKTKDGRSCLHLAAQNGHFEICEALLQKYNFDIHATDDFSCTALHGAAWSGDLELLEYLIENGSDIFSETKDGRSCLHLAAQNGHFEICKALLEKYNFDIHATDDSSWTALHGAAWSGDLELFQYLIENGSDVFSKTKDGRSCFHLAAEEGHLKICKLLLKNYNFDIHARDDDMFTVMLRASCSDDLELLEYLIQNGSDILSKTKHGGSCLHLAAENGHLKICKALLEKYNFDIHATDDSSWTALHGAAWSGDLELFQYLIEKGSDIFIKTKNNSSCLHFAAKVGSLKICRVVLQNYNFDINARDDDGLTILHSAAWSGDSELLQYLIEKGSDVFSKTKNGRSCLHIAAEQGHLKICRILLRNHNFAIHERDDDGLAVLHNAALAGDLELFQYLIENGSDVFSKTKNGRSCLHIAAEEGYLKICRVLLENYKFDVHERDDNGLAVLHNAALGGDLELFQYLIENGSDVFSKTKDGRSCFHLAAEEGHLKICKLLLKNYNFDIHARDDDMFTVMLRASCSDDLELLEYLIQNGSDILSKTKHGGSCLHLAAENGHLKICKALLEKYNFDIHATDDSSWTALHGAAWSGDLELFQYLIEKGSDIFIKTKNNSSCLHFAAKVGSLKICRVVLQNYNFDINARDDDGLTILHSAAWSGDSELLQYLIEKGSDVFSKTKNGRSCLHIAAEQRHLKICRILLRNHNFAIHERDDDGLAVLHNAALAGDLELFQYLIENGSDVFSKTKNGRSCLHIAAEEGYLKICRVLLENYKFDVHERDDNGLAVLHNAALAGDLELFQYLIENGSDVFSKTKDGRSCFHLAAEEGHLKICKLLLKNYNFDIHARDDDMFTVMLRASCSDDLELLEYLIQNGSDILSKTKHGGSCLHLAAKNGHLKICKALLEKYNFDIHATDDSSWTALHGAAWSGDLELFQYLIEKGSDIFIKTKNNSSCLHFAAKVGSLKICRVVLQNYNFDINARDDDGLTILHSAAWSGDSELLQYLIEKGSDVFSKTKNGRSCLHIAAEQGHLKICRMLLTHYNFAIHERDDDGLAVLHNAALGGDLELFQYLIENGSDLFSKTKNGRSCFHIAAEEGYLKICRVLLENYNFDVHERDDDGLAVLHNAALAGDLELFQYLIENGSDVFSKTKDGRSCFHLAAEEGHLKICKLLLKNYNFDIHARDDDMFTVMLRASCGDDLELLEYLIQNGSDILSKTKHGGSCLHLAAKNGHLKICKALLEKYNFDIHATDDSSWTALHGAAWSGDLELLQYLIENGSDIFSETNDGRSCLHLAAIRGHLKICRALLQNYNLDMYARDDSGLYVLHHAAWSGYLELFQYLIEKGSDIFIKTKNNSSCLHFAAKVGSLKICRVVLQNYNFDINARDDDGLTILHSAAWSGDSELLQYLIEKGSDVYSKTKNGRSCLHIAAEQGHLKICRMLLTHYNFAIHERDDDGLAVLHNAALGGDLELFQYLIENGSDVFSKTKNGRSCFHIAAEEGYLKICRVLLENYNFDVHEIDDDGLAVLHNAALAGDLELFQYLIESGSDVFSKTTDGRSCLHIASRQGHLKVCRALLQNYNFDISVRDDSGWSVLHHAACSFDLEIFQYLIEKGSDIFAKAKSNSSCLHIAAQVGDLKICKAVLQNYDFDINARDDDGFTFLHSAAWSGYSELLQYLIENGSDIFSKTKNGRSCLHIAAEQGHLNICRMLLQRYNFLNHERDDDGLNVLHSAVLSGELELLHI